MVKEEDRNGIIFVNYIVEKNWELTHLALLLHLFKILCFMYVWSYTVVGGNTQ